MDNAVGEFKNNKISLNSFCLKRTYEGYLALSKKIYERENIKIISEIKNNFKNIFGDNLPIYFLKDRLELTQRLPELICYAELMSSVSIREGSGSHLGIIYFQDKISNPLESVRKILQKIDWEKEAKDFDY